MCDSGNDCVYSDDPELHAAMVALTALMKVDPEGTRAMIAEVIGSERGAPEAGCCECGGSGALVTCIIDSCFQLVHRAWHDSHEINAHGN